MNIDIIKKYIHDDKKRPALLKKSLFLFGLYYFTNFFTSPSADFHKQRAKDLDSDKSLFLLGFRESAKTVWSMIKLIKLIVYKEANFVLVYSYEQRLAGARLFDIIVQLKTNKKLIKDFGNLYPDQKEEDGLSKKTRSNFITSNSIQFLALSISTTSRGLLYITKDQKAYRPDFVVFDDVDTIESVRNPDIVQKNIDFVEGEVFGGLSSDCRIIFLGNVISNIGLVPYFYDKFQTNDRRICRKKAVVEDGKITWDRFVFTDEERDERLEKGIKKISLESKKQDQGDNYDPNFLLIPNIRSGNPVFNHESVLQRYEPPYKIDENYRDLKIYQDPQEDLTFGIDSSMGNHDGDFSTITGRNNRSELVISYKSRVDPRGIVEVMEYLFDIGYIGNIIPERNSIGQSTIDQLLDSKCAMFIYREKTIDRITNRTVNKYGFYTGTNKTRLVDAYKNACSSDITEFDSRLKDEALHFYRDSKGSANAISGHHDDLIISDVLVRFALSQSTSLYFN